MILTSPQTKCKVSSVLNRSSLYVAKNMFDDLSDTCWNSDQGSPQIVTIDFEKPCQIQKVLIMFQGGFVGNSGTIEVAGPSKDFYKVQLIENIDDSNDLQELSFPPSIVGQYLKISFATSTDFYGRVIIYKLVVCGNKIEY